MGLIAPLAGIPIDPNAWSTLFGVWLPPIIVGPIIVAVCTFFATLAYRLGALAWLKLSSYFDQIIVDCPINLTTLDKKLEEYNLDSLPMFCLLVRFGNDKYLTNIASDQEKFEGRLQNKIILIDLSQDIVKLKLPIHRRMGTQFKLYLLAKNKDESVKIWKTLTEISKKISVGITLDSDEPKGRKIWFRLTNFDTAITVEGHENNICLPDRIKNFEKTSVLIPWTKFRVGELEDD